MASFFHAAVGVFLSQTNEQVLARLSVAYAQRGYTSQYADQTLAWERDLRSLRAALQDCLDASALASSWGLLLEFSIPCKEVRIDVVLLVRNTIIVIESKTAQPSAAANRQLEEYALLLHYFHKASFERRIVPLLIAASTEERSLAPHAQGELFPQLAVYWIASVERVQWQALARTLLALNDPDATQIDVCHWNQAIYRPVPSILEAAIALRTGLDIREIAHSEASEHEIDEVRDTLQHIVLRSREAQEHAICFLTGVPGSGKTLVGLSLAHSERNQTEPVHFMSGNGPLVQVLQHLFTRESMRKGESASQSRIEARTLVQNIHVFARYYTEDNPGAPANHAIVFDEAQRAWDRTQNLRKFKRPYSEPEMLLSIMERLPDWAVVIALVGGGQEINDGEAGLEEWGKALESSAKLWKVYASPEVIDGGQSTAGHRLLPSASSPDALSLQTTSKLHLRTSNRSLRAENLATWVNYVLAGDSDAAAALYVTKAFPILLSRDLAQTRQKLREFCLGETRFGLVGSSGATRLRAEGLEPSSSFHAEYPWEHWYLAGESDVRSSYQCEVFATEFEIQGLELDWVGLCWGGDFVWTGERGWLLRAFRQGARSHWSSIRNEAKRTYRRNAYRVLLTRARQGMVIFLPQGSAGDSTRDPGEFDRTAEYLLRCGVVAL